MSIRKSRIIRIEENVMNTRTDKRNPLPQKTHRAAFLAGWTEAEKGHLYDSNTKKKTHTNMGNLFGWIFGEKSDDFKLQIWELYLENALDIEEE